MFEYIFPISLTLQKLQNDTSGGFCFGLPEDDCKEGLDFWFTADPSSTPENRVSVIQFNLIPAALGFEETDVSGTSFSTLFYIPLTYKISQPGPDPADWTSYGYEYCGQGPYDSAEALAEAYDSGELTLCPTGITDDYDPNWSGFTRRGPLRPFSDLSPPVVVEPDGPRYITEGKKISWMDWELHADQHPRFGTTLHDIRFKGKRIIYELALQETYAAYSGYSGHGEVRIFTRPCTVVQPEVVKGLSHLSLAAFTALLLQITGHVPRLSLWRPRKFGSHVDQGCRLSRNSRLLPGLQY